MTEQPTSKRYRHNEMSFRPDDRLHREIKKRAFRAGLTVPAFVTECLREFLNGKKGKAR